MSGSIHRRSTISWIAVLLLIPRSAWSQAPPTPHVRDVGHYRFSTAFKAGQQIEGHTITSLTAEWKQGHSTAISHGPLQLRDDGVIAFTAKTDKGAVGVFSPDKAWAVVGEKTAGVTITQILDVATGGTTTAYIAQYTGPDCPSCLGVFKNASLEFSRNVREPYFSTIRGLEVDGRGGAYWATVTTGRTTLFYEGRELLHTGQPIGDGAVSGIGEVHIGSDGKSFRVDVGITANGRVVSGAFDGHAFQPNESKPSPSIGLRPITIDGRTVMEVGSVNGWSVKSITSFAASTSSSQAKVNGVLAQTPFDGGIYGPRGLLVSGSGFRTRSGYRVCCVFSRVVVNYGGDIAYVVAADAPSTAGLWTIQFARPQVSPTCVAVDPAQGAADASRVSREAYAKAQDDLSTAYGRLSLGWARTQAGFTSAFADYIASNVPLDLEAATKSCDIVAAVATGLKFAAPLQSLAYSKRFSDRIAEIAKEVGAENEGWDLLWDKLFDKTKDGIERMFVLEYLKFGLDYDELKAAGMIVPKTLEDLEPFLKNPRHRAFRWFIQHVRLVDKTLKIAALPEVYASAKAGFGVAIRAIASGPNFDDRAYLAVLDTAYRVGDAAVSMGYTDGAPFRDIVTAFYAAARQDRDSAQRAASAIQGR